MTVIALCASALLSGQENKPDPRDEAIQKLLSRVEALEREVAALKAAPTADVVTPLSPPVSTQKTDLPAVAAQPEPHEPDRFSFHGYADAGFERNVRGDSTKKFALGEVDFFVTARISTNWNALVEAVFETDDQKFTSEVPVNIERLLLQYRPNDYINLDIGSYRNAIGYYSTAYLRGAWLQTALTRPRLFLFEDDTGFLPLHNAGVSVNGRVPSGALNLHYVVEVGSSRNYAQNGPILNAAHNRAINVALAARPRAIPGLDVGFSSYHDRFSPVQGYLLDRSVWAAHVVYASNRIEFLNEGVLATYRDSAGGYATVPGFYSQFSYRVRPDLRPYVRYEYVNANGTGQEAVIHQYAPWRTIWSGGVRYDLAESVALKFELGRETNWLQKPWIRAAMQVAFTF